MSSMDTLKRILVDEAGFDVPRGFDSLTPSQIREMLADAGIDVSDDSRYDFMSDFLKGRNQ